MAKLVLEEREEGMCFFAQFSPITKRLVLLAVQGTTATHRKVGIWYISYTSTIIPPVRASRRYPQTVQFGTQASGRTDGVT